MRITVVCKGRDWELKQLQNEAKKLSIDLEVIDISTLDSIPNQIGDTVIWRSSSITISDSKKNHEQAIEDRKLAMQNIMNRATLINRCSSIFPYAREKFFQQKHVSEKLPFINCIPTFQFQTKDEIIQAIENKILHLPFITKPNIGSKGNGVILIRNIYNLEQCEKNFSEMVFQNFIKNSGDYRVFILGGKAIGVIKRIAKNGGFLNNISQGGSAETVTDTKILKILNNIGSAVASAFHLTICGVDIIYDEIEKKFFFLEVNTTPQWRGFQGTTKINVAKDILLFCNRLSERASQQLFSVVKNEYDSHIHLLQEKKFHYLSRLFLWTGENMYKKQIDKLQKEYIGINEKESFSTLKKLYESPIDHGSFMPSKKEREPYFKKYPHLEPCLNLLFKNLFSKKIYNINLRTSLQKIIDDTMLITLKNNLLQDEDAIRVLSTHAINFFYLLENYLPSNPEVKIDAQQYLKIGTNYTEMNAELQLYFFTHCIIGASKFYSESIKKEDKKVYLTMLKISEKIIQKNFKNISLDNKFEFLVCAKICGFQSSVEKNIYDEASQSLSPDGNFLIDTKNDKATQIGRNTFVGSEHRNVLFIMSQIPFRFSLHKKY